MLYKNNYIKSVYIFISFYICENLCVYIVILYKFSI